MSDFVPAPSLGSDLPEPKSFISSLRNLWRAMRRVRNGDSSVRDTLEELIEERDDADQPINDDERLLLANILELRVRIVHDVMVPRADIVSVGVDTIYSEIIDIITREGHSRLPVFGESLDDAIGFIHAKDVLAWRSSEVDFSPSRILRRLLFVAPSMQVLELLLEMRVKRAHMALVVDEYGGVDGLVTIEDLVEEIVGEIEDEHDQNDEPALAAVADGSLVADARVTIDSLEETIGPILNDEEREDIDTLGGLVFSLAGRVPIRGELIHHISGMEFEVLEADPRRIRRLRVRKISQRSGGD